MIVPGVDFLKYSPWVVALVVFINHAVRIVPDGARLVVCRLGQFNGLRGPGLVFTIPIVEKSIKIKEGDNAILTDSSHLTIKNISVPVRVVDSAKVGARIVVHSFSDQEVLVVSANQEERA
jgi:regulator of protease activity HflC (stomatin/prohibitin superfamily)